MTQRNERSYPTKTSFLREASKESYRGVNNAYDLNRTGHYCGSKTSPSRTAKRS